MQLRWIKHIPIWGYLFFRKGEVVDRRVVRLHPRFPETPLNYEYHIRFGRVGLKVKAPLKMTLSRASKVQLTIKHVIHIPQIL